MFNKILLASIIALFIVSDCLAQNKVDLELTVQSAAKTVRGGETFAYSITVRNIGSAKATNVLINQDEAFMMPFISYAPSKGTCLVSDFERRVDRRLHCKLTDLEAGETVVVSVELKIRDFGDVSPAEDSGARDYSPSASENSQGNKENRQDTLNKKPLEDLGDFISSQVKAHQNSIGDVRVSAKEREENEENNSAEIFVELLPSKNIPPHVKILSPADNSTVVRSPNKQGKVDLKIQAFDPDGTIEKVEVRFNLPFVPSPERPQTHIVVQGKEYSLKEIQENPAMFEDISTREAVKTGKDTYTFTQENPPYGFNRVEVAAYDNGGRIGGTILNFTVESDHSIEFVSPIENSLFKPGTDINIETICKLNGGKLTGLKLSGVIIYGGASVSPIGETPMNLISTENGQYRHRYTLKKAETGIYNLMVYLTEDSGASAYSKNFYFTVTEKPTIKIKSLNSKLTFNEDENIPLIVEAADADGRIAEPEFFVNGKKEYFYWRTDDNGAYRNGYLSGRRKGTYTITAKVKDELKVEGASAKVKDDLNIETESEPLTIVVK